MTVKLDLPDALVTNREGDIEESKDSTTASFIKPDLPGVLVTKGGERY